MIDKILSSIVDDNFKISKKVGTKKFQGRKDRSEVEQESNPWKRRQNKSCKRTQEPKSVKKTRGVSQKIFDGGICNIYYPHPQPAEIKNPRPCGGG